MANGMINILSFGVFTPRASNMWLYLEAALLCSFLVTQFDTRLHCVHPLEVPRMGQKLAFGRLLSLPNPLLMYCAIRGRKSMSTIFKVSCSSFCLFFPFFYSLIFWLFERQSLQFVWRFLSAYFPAILNLSPWHCISLEALLAFGFSGVMDFGHWFFATLNWNICRFVLFENDWPGSWPISVCVFCNYASEHHATVYMHIFVLTSLRAVHDKSRMGPWMPSWVDLNQRSVAQNKPKMPVH